MREQATETKLKVGGVNLDHVLIDSGVLCNLIDLLKHIGCESMRCNKALFAFVAKSSY